MSHSSAYAFSGRKTFLAGSIALIVFGAVHLFAVYQANFTIPADPKIADMQAAAKAYTVPIGPLTASAWSGMQILNSSYSIWLIYAGALNLLTFRPAAQTGRLRALTVCNLLFIALLLGITILFQFPPPMLFAGVALILFGVSWWKQSWSVN